MSMTRGIKFLFITAVICVVLVVAAYMVFAHPGGLAKDGCHKDNAAGERHYHLADTTDRAGVCEKHGDVTYRIATPTPCPVCEPTIVEKPVEVVVEKVVTRNSVDVQAFEDAHKRVLAAIRQTLNRPPQIVEVPKEVPTLKATSEECVQLRVAFQAVSHSWGNSSDDIADEAISKGCW